MADSSRQPPRGADLDALKRKLAELNAKYRPVLDQLSSETALINERLQVAEQYVQREAAAADRTGAARKRAVKDTDRSASSAERLAKAEQTAAIAAERRAEAELAAARAAQVSAAAVERIGARQLAPGVTPRQLPPGAGPARFIAGPGGYGYATTDLQNQPPERLQIPQTTVGGSRYSPADFVRGQPAGGGETNAPSVYAAAMHKQGDAERAAAEATQVRRGAVNEATAADRAYVEEALNSKRVTADLGKEFERNAQRLGLVGNAYQRNGYLTSEFINAAVRGQVTAREFGTQVLGTIGKFAGWTAAATAVYGVVRALGAVGRGAIDSESGVNQLNRVVTKELPGGADAAKQKFRELSHEFNLPISDVTDAVYGMAKAFRGDLPAAFEAARASLLAVKVGELSTADATRYLTAIINGFGLKASQLGDVFDALNQLQNRFGGNVTNVAAGVAKAAGVFKAAGGDYLTLTKLIQAGVKTTGATGENVGTAIGRSAGRVLTEAGQKALADVGLNGALPYPELFAQALQKSAHANPQTLNKIARALVPQGGQFARIFIPLLQNPDLLAKIDAELRKRAGSGEREKGRLLKAPTEQIQRLSTEAQDLGSALGEAGALTPLLALVKTLNLGVHELTQMVTLAEKIAGPLKGAVVPALELVAAYKLAQKFGLFRGANAGYGAEVEKGARDVRTEQARVYQGSLTSADTAAVRANALGARATLLESEIKNTTDLSKQVVLAEELNGVRAQQLRFSEQAVAASQQADFAQREIATLEARVAQFKRLQLEGLTAQAAAQQAGIVYRSGSLATNTAGSPIPVQPVPGGPSTRFAVSGTGETTDLSAKIEQQAAVEEQAIAEQGRVAQQLSRLGVVGTGLAAGMGIAGRAVDKSITGMRGVLGGVRGLLAKLGPLDYLLIGFIGLEAASSALHKYQADAKKAQDSIGALTGGPEGVRQSIRKATKGPGFFASLGQDISDTAHQFTHPTELFDPYHKTQADKDSEARKALADKLSSVPGRLAAYRAGGKLLTQGDIDAQLKVSLKSATSDAERVAAYDEALAKARVDRVALAERLLGRRFRPNRGDKTLQQAFLTRLKEQAAQARIDASQVGPAGQVAQLDLDHLATYDQGTGSRLQLQGPTRGNASRLQATLHRLTELAGQAKGDNQIGKVVKLVGQLNSEAQQIVDAYVQSHPTSDPVKQVRVKNAGLALARRALGLDNLKRQATDTRKEIAALSDGIAKEQAGVEKVAAQAAQESQQRHGREVGPGPIAAGMQKLQQHADADRAKVGKLKQLLRLLDELISGVFGSLSKTSQDAHASFQAAQGLYEANTSLQSAQAGGGTPGDRVAARRQGARLNAIAKEYGRNSVEFINAQADYLNAQNSITSEEQSAAKDAAQKAKENADKAREAAKTLISARADYRSSLTTDPVKETAIRLQEAIRLRAYAQGKAERLEADANVNTTRRAHKQAIQQGKFDDIEFYASIGKLSKDAEIAQLGALLKRIKGNKDLRRSIQQKLYELKHDAANDTSLDLTVGDIHLPTLYDVRRLIASGASGGPAHQIHQEFHMNVTTGADVDEVFATAAKHVSTGGRAQMRSAGLIG